MNRSEDLLNQFESRGQKVQKRNNNKPSPRDQSLYDTKLTHSSHRNRLDKYKDEKRKERLEIIKNLFAHVIKMKDIKDIITVSSNTSSNRFSLSIRVSQIVSNGYFGSLYPQSVNNMIEGMIKILSKIEGVLLDYDSAVISNDILPNISMSFDIDKIPKDSIKYTKKVVKLLRAAVASTKRYKDDADD